MIARAIVVAALTDGGLTAPALAQDPLHQAAPADCSTNPNCAHGLKQAYDVDATPHLVKLADADSGIQALDDGLAEVAVAFSSNPELSRPDIVTLRDDKHMIGPDRVVPVMRSSLLDRYGSGLRRRVNAASRLLSTLALRSLNQQVIDGRLPEAVGGEFVDANGLGGSGKRMPGPKIVIGYQAFDENQTLAYMYAEALRGAGFRVDVRASGLRPATVKALRTGRIGMYPAYSDTIREYLGGKTLREAVAKLHAEPTALSPAQDANTFTMKKATGEALGITKISDLGRYWGKGVLARAASDPLQDEQWAVAPQSVLDLPGAWQLSQGTGVTVAIVDTGAKLDPPGLAPNIWTNFGEVPGNGIDDDHNGYVDDVHGIDLSSKASGQNLGDGYGHGTHVAGIVAAARNGSGVVGVAPQAKLMIVRIFDDQGAGTTGAVAEGIRYAAANGARVINCSLEGTTNDPRLAAAIQAAGQANALVVAGAGGRTRGSPRGPATTAATSTPSPSTRPRSPRPTCWPSPPPTRPRGRAS